MITNVGKMKVKFRVRFRKDINKKKGCPRKGNSLVCVIVKILI
jgi:hypothetical protein